MARKKRTTKRSKCGVANKMPVNKKPASYFRKLVDQLRNIISFLLVIEKTWHFVNSIPDKLTKLQEFFNM